MRWSGRAGHTCSERQVGVLGSPAVPLSCATFEGPRDWKGRTANALLHADDLYLPPRVGKQPAHNPHSTPWLSWRVRCSNDAETERAPAGCWQGAVQIRERTCCRSTLTMPDARFAVRWADQVVENRGRPNRASRAQSLPASSESGLLFVLGSLRSHGIPWSR